MFLLYLSRFIGRLLGRTPNKTAIAFYSFQFAVLMAEYWILSFLRHIRPDLEPARRQFLRYIYLGQFAEYLVVMPDFLCNKQFS